MKGSAAAGAYLLGRHVRESLDAACQEIRNLEPRRSERGQTRHWKAVGRQHNSVVFYSEAPLPGASQGVFLKVPLNRARVNAWDVHAEVRNFHTLAEHGPRESMYCYLRPVAYGSDPPFLALPYFPGQSLRRLLRDAAKSGNDCAGMALVEEACWRAGRWLGLIYCRRQNGSELMAWRDEAFICDRLAEIKRYTPCSMPRDRILRVVLEKVKYQHESNWGGADNRVCHGDFCQDNILVGNAGGEVCLIDPEPLGGHEYSDFAKFRECLAIYAFRSLRGTVAHPVYTLCGKAFATGVREACPSCAEVGQYFAYSVISRVAVYWKQGRHRMVPKSPRQAIRWLDQYRLSRYWTSWLSGVPSNSDGLWEYIEETL